MHFNIAFVLIISISSVLGLPNASSDQCKKGRGFTGQIVGGERAKKGDWRWVVAFIHWRSENYFCGGSLISTRHILSGKSKVS